PEIRYCQTMFGGKVAVRPPQESHNIDSWFRQPVPQEVPNLEYAISLLACWPEVYRQFPKIIHTIFPFAIQLDSKHGSSSAPDPGNFGAIYVSVFDPIGTAEALVHELAHQKLLALGVGFELANRIVSNSPQERYPSPVREKPRPMTALLHATYSWLHVVELDVRLLSVECEGETDPEVLNTFVHHYLNRNLQILLPAFDVVAKNIKCDRAGRDFFSGMRDWKSYLTDESQRILEKIEKR
ncbi:MAG: HEXXH motif-containing putative peptide modification protein, partial [Candidatus Poribacteria bacterium]|nr:HEXXH motif-containing putative peptide modification protein [Candidatus Poribacteria bacterium]